jgi:hypothetical protein
MLEAEDIKKDSCIFVSNLDPFSVGIGNKRG